ncbi:MAG: hypothetical protein HY064_07990 [Bacteroidetes bacterium]|nr:hypothetical protein [Bacteroidota bacterium]
MTAAAAKIVFGLVFLFIYIMIKVARGKNNAPKMPPQTNYPNPFLQQQQQNRNPFPPSHANPQNNPKPNYRDTFTSPENFQSQGNFPPPQTSNAYYCMYCGKRFSTIDLLMKDTCFKHPKSEQGLQKHVLYRGVGKPNIGW